MCFFKKGVYLKWVMYMTIQEMLFEKRDTAYRDFQSKLIPTVPKKAVIGIRTPTLRLMAKRLFGTAQAAFFLDDLPHTYYEENNLHAFLLERLPTLDEALKETRRFLPYVDNWATCDSFLPKSFRKQPERLLTDIENWLFSKHTYTVRYAVGLLMKLFLDERFQPKYMQMVAELRSDEYYVQMMQAWYFATALDKQYKEAIIYLEQHRLPQSIHNKTIQKAVESRRISHETKVYLKTLRRKEQTD